MVLRSSTVSAPPDVHDHVGLAGTQRRRMLGVGSGIVRAGACLLVGLAGGLWLASAPFTIDRTVTVDIDALLVQTHRLEQREMHIRCTRDGQWYVTDSGEMLFFSTESPSDPSPLCEAAWDDRRLRAAGVAVLGLLVAIGVAFAERVRRRHEESPQVTAALPDNPTPPAIEPT